MNYSSGPLTTREVATIFAVTTVTVQRWADKGALPYFKTPGNRYRFLPEDVQQLKARLTHNAA